MASGSCNLLSAAPLGVVAIIEVEGDGDEGRMLTVWRMAAAAGSGGLRSESKEASELEEEDAMGAEAVANRLKENPPITYTI